MHSRQHVFQIRRSLHTALSSGFSKRVRSRRTRPVSNDYSCFTVQVNSLEPRILLAADFGDAPLPYPVTLAENGAQHTTTGPTLGATRDSEANGVHSAAANADGADEDGVTFGSIRVGQLDATITVNVQNAPSGARLDAWIDFNQDGSWGGASEHIAANLSVLNGNNSVSFDVPSWTIEGTTFCRVRLSTAGNLGVIGLANDGEVEDHVVAIDSSLQTPGEFNHYIGVLDGTTPVSVAAADFDGDGDMDVLGAFPGNTLIAWGENDGAENFVQRTISATANDVQSVCAEDIDGDGDVDVLAALTGGTQRIVWYENNGSGVFTSRTISSTGRATSVVAADMDRDGDMDIFCGTQDLVNIAWYENDGNQNFTSRVVFAGNSGEGHLVAAIDADQDGDMDVVAAMGHGGISWYENNGNQNFTGHLIESGAVFEFSSVFAADIDGDSDMDVAAVALEDVFGSNQGSVVWYDNNGAQSFTKRNIDGFGGADSVFVADLNGDGHRDILAAARFSNRVRWYQNNGDRQFTMRVLADSQGSAIFQGTSSTFAADIDSDGAMDAIFGFVSMSLNRIGWFQNLVGLDYGDAPLPYPVTLAENGARHVLVGPYLGLRRNTEADGVHTGPEITPGADRSDDGIQFGSFHSGNTTGSIDLTASAAGKLDAWVDFNQDGDWTDAGEQIFVGRSLIAGRQDLTFSSPNPLLEGVRYARFRISSAGGLSPTGEAPDGEVEDYAFGIAPPRPTLIGPSGVVSTLRPTLTWNASIGAEKYRVSLTKFNGGKSLSAIVDGTSFTPSSDLEIGGYNWQVVAIGPLSEESNPSRQLSFEIRVPVTGLQVTSPATDVTPTLTWTAVPGAAKYDVWIDNLTTNQTQFIRNQNVLTTSFTPASDLPFGNYRAWVRVFDDRGQQGPWSAALDFSVVPLPAPVITQGQNPTFDRTPTFAWNAVPDAAKYDVVIRNVKNGRTVVDQRNIVDTSWTPTTPLPDGPYLWWVSAITSTNVRGLWTQETPITIGGKTNMLSPIGSTSDTTPTFTWRPVDGAARYDLWVDRLGGATQVIRQQNLTSPSFTASTLPAGNYRSWVRAISTTGEFAPWSVFVDFTIAENSGSDDALLVNLAIDEIFADSVENPIEVVGAESADAAERRHSERDDDNVVSELNS